MKTNKLFAVAAMLPVLFSCAKDEIRTNDNLSGDGQKYDFTITVSGDEDSITKASLSDKDGIFWVKEGKAGIVNAGGDRYESNALSNIYDYNGYQQASFAFTNTSEGEYKFFYPYHNEATLDKIPFWVAPNQTTKVGESADCFALVSNDMVSLTVKNDIPAETTYKVVGSYIRFKVYGKADETVRYIITEGVGSTVSGRYFVNGNDNTLRSGETDLKAETITLTVDGEYKTKADAASAKGLYVAVLPESSKNTYTVMTDKGFYQFASESEKEFKFGSIKDIPLNLSSSKAVKTAPEALYVIGDATTAGWTEENAIVLEKVKNENKYKIENIQLVPGGQGFKFLTQQGNWENVFVNAGDNTTLAYYVGYPPEGKDTKFTVDKAGLYDLVVDFDAFTVTTTLKTEFPRVISHKTDPKTYWMLPTGNPGEFKALGVYVAKQKDSDGGHDFFIKEGDKGIYHAASNVYVEINKGSLNGNVYTCAVVKDENQTLGWWINDNDNMTKRQYDFTLNTNTNTLTLNFTQGKNFWLVGDPFAGWTADDNYKSTADENGIVTWEVTTNNTGEWKICGEHTSGTGDDFWSGEWYYAVGISYPFNWSWDGGNNYTTADANKDGFDVDVFCGDQKWKFNETGKFKITFDSKNLKIKVEKLQ